MSEKFNFYKSFRIRCLLTILKWNDENWFFNLDMFLFRNRLSLKNQEILTHDSKKIKIQKEKANEEKARFIRNAKRLKAKIINKVKAEGHQYANNINSQKLKEKRCDPNQRIAIIPLPRITNHLSSNCFVNSYLQIFRHTNIYENLVIGNNLKVYEFMQRLNDGENLNEIIINESRYLWSPPFSLFGQEDVSEFCQFIFQELYEKIKTKDNFCSISFLDAYQYTLTTELCCSCCNNINIVSENNFILNIPTIENTFHKNYNSIFSGNVEKFCDECETTQIFNF